MSFARVCTRARDVVGRFMTKVPRYTGHLAARWLARCLILTFFVATGLAACGGGDDERSNPEGWGQGLGEGEQPNSNPQGEGCAEGEERTCHITLGRHNGVLSCYTGAQRCEGGEWGECTDGVVENKISPGPDFTSDSVQGSADSEWKSYSKAKPCSQNPCDPSCTTWEEQPDGGLGVTGEEFIFNWKQGKKSNLPGDVYQKAFDEPCQIGSDCQMNHYCYDPDSGSCGHDICSTGTGLADGCSPCVTEICKTKPQCCGTLGGSSCSHTPCKTGSGLKPSCDPFVKKVCAADKTCCPYSITTNVCGWKYSKYSCKKSKYCWSWQPCLKSYQCGWKNYGCTKCGYKWKCWNQYKCGYKPYCYWKTKCKWTLKKTKKYKCVTQYKWKCGYSWKTVCTTQWKKVPKYSWCPWWFCPKKWVKKKTCKYKKVYSCKLVKSSYCYSYTVYSWVKSCYQYKYCYNKWQCGYQWTCGNKWSCWWSTCKKPKYCYKNSTCYKYGKYCKYWSTCYGYQWKCTPKTKNYAGSWKSSCVTKYKQYGGTCTSGTWDQSCVDAVHDKCGAFCKDPPPPTGDGECIPWDPGQKDDKCNGISLAVGFTCDDPVGTVPICNHGKTNAPKGITIMHVPKNSGAFGKSNPGNVAGAQYCTTDQEIPAGQCINVTTCKGLTNGREIMVNPKNQPTECYHGDNWGIYVTGKCGPPTCAGDNIKAKLKPVNMFITVDKSGSMWSRWTPTRKAFNAFFKDKNSAGMSVGLEFWPMSSCGYSCNSSGVAACAKPYVPFGKLLASYAPTDKHEKALTDAFNKTSPGGGTPGLVALKGAESWASSYTKTHPNEQQVVIFVTDGYPNTCGGSHGPFVTAAKDAYDNYGVLTYGIGIVGASTSLLNKVAAAGGTTKGMFIDSNNQIEQKLIQAMQKIKGDTVSCDFILPKSNVKYDPEDAEVTYTPSKGGSPIPIAEVAGAGSCGKGWYFDDKNNPTKIILCPLTCTAVQNDPEAEIDISFGCPGGYEETVHTQTYQASCPPGTTTQWGYLAWDAVTPSSSKATFDMRTATSKAGLASATYLNVAVAQSKPTDTQVCKMSGPAPCPTDLVTKLGSQAYSKSWLELRVTNTPNGKKNKAPTLNSWNITYSCPAAE